MLSFCHISHSCTGELHLLCTSLCLSKVHELNRRCCQTVNQLFHSCRPAPAFLLRAFTTHCMLEQIMHVAYAMEILNIIVISNRYPVPTIFLPYPRQDCAYASMWGELPTCDVTRALSYDHHLLPMLYSWAHIVAQKELSHWLPFSSPRSSLQVML